FLWPASHAWAYQGCTAVAWGETVPGVGNGVGSEVNADVYANLLPEGYANPTTGGHCQFKPWAVTTWTYRAKVQGSWDIESIAYGGTTVVACSGAGLPPT